MAEDIGVDAGDEIPLFFDTETEQFVYGNKRGRD